MLRVIARVVVVSAAAGLVLSSPAAAFEVVVNTTADGVTNDASCSLREAVNAANTNTAGNGCSHDGSGGADIITLPAGNFDLTGTANENSNAGGDLDIYTGVNFGGFAGGALTIDGAGRAATSIRKANDTADRVINNLFGSLKLEDLTVSGGRLPAGSGGGIRSETTISSLALVRVQVKDNQALGQGGVTSDGSTTVEASLIGPSNISLSNIAGGGGLYIDGDFTMTDSEVFENAAMTGSGGGVVLDDDANFNSITDSRIHDNDATGANTSGAGIQVRSGSGNLTITGSEIVDNGDNQTSNGGGIAFGPQAAAILTIGDTEISRNRANSAGGGVYGSGNTGSITIDDSVLADNRIESATASGANGGAMFTNIGTTITDTAITGNQLIAVNTLPTLQGAALFLRAETVLERSLLAGNTATGESVSATIRVDNFVGAGLEMINSTVSGNSYPADANAASVLFSGAGSNGARITNSTITGNSAGATPRAFSVSGAITLKNSIFDHGVAVNACGNATDLGGNIDRGTSCNPGSTPDENKDPMIGPLANNGGPTRTHAPLLGSPAIDRVIAANCTTAAAVTVTADQRGAPRPTGTDCDIGAHEVTDERIVITQETVPAGLASPFSFTSDIPGNGSFSLGHGAERAIETPAPGSYTVTQAAVGGIPLSQIDCDDDASATPSGSAGAAALLKLDFNETLRCRFVNTKSADPPPVEPSLTLALTAKPKLPAGKLRAQATCSIACTVVTSAKGKAGGDKFKSTKSQSQIPAGVPTRVSAPLKSKVLKAVQGEKGGGTLTAVATAAGQSAVAKDTFVLK